MYGYDRANIWVEWRFKIEHTKHQIDFKSIENMWLVVAALSTQQTFSNWTQLLSIKIEKVHFQFVCFCNAGALTTFFLFDCRFIPSSVTFVPILLTVLSKNMHWTIWQMWNMEICKMTIIYAQIWNNRAKAWTMLRKNNWTEPNSNESRGSLYLLQTSGSDPWAEKR